jgi:hypothetical protein
MAISDRQVIKLIVTVNVANDPIPVNAISAEVKNCQNKSFHQGSEIC